MSHDVSNAQMAHAGPMPDPATLRAAMDMLSTVETLAEGKRRAVELVAYLESLGDEEASRKASLVRSCSGRIDVDEAGGVLVPGIVRCKQARLCANCARWRAMRYVRRYLLAIRNRFPGHHLYAWNLTIPNGPDLAERFGHLGASLRRLKSAWYDARGRGRGGPLAVVDAAVWSIEVKRGEGSGEWHPHVHGLLLCSERVRYTAFLPVWRRCASATNSRMIALGLGAEAEPKSDLCEVFKYALKLSGIPPADQWAANLAMHGRHLLRTWGELRGLGDDGWADDDSEAAGGRELAAVGRWCHDTASYVLQSPMASESITEANLRAIAEREADEAARARDGP